MVSEKHHNMLLSKDTTILLEINDFFTSSEKAIETVFNTLRSLKLSESQFFIKGKQNNVYKNTDKLLLTTDVALSFDQAYKIYATRWSIEVLFKGSKQFLGLGKCESHDFDVQITHTTLCMLQYNILSTVKRFENYETFGELSKQV